MIAETAIALAKENSFASASIAEVARRLNVTPMALYHHVDSKRDIEQIIARHIFDHEVPVVNLSKCPSWRDAVFETYSRLWDILMQNPDMLPAFLDQRFVYSDEHLRHVEVVIKALEMGGIPVEQIRSLCRMFGRIVTGSVYLASYTTSEDPASFDSESQSMDSDPDAKLSQPLIHAVVVPSDRRSDFHAILNLVLDLLEAQYGGHARA